MAVDVQWAAGEESINFMCWTPQLVELFLFCFLFLFRSLRLRTDLCNCAVLLESTECSTQADSPKVNVTSRRITTPRLKGSAKDKSIYVCAWL